MGLPECVFVPERLVRVIFTTSVEARDLEDVISTLFPNPPWSQLAAQWPGMYKLVTPLADDLTSEKPESVREEIGVNAYFVRESARSFTLTFARQPAELGRLIKQLRCQRTLGAFLVDAEGVVWGLRAGALGPGATTTAERVQPIPIQPATLDGRFEFATPTTVPRWIFQFQAAVYVKDEDLVPIWSGRDILIYQPPVHLYTRTVNNAGTWTVFVYARFARGAGEDNIIPLAATPTPAPTAYDASGAPMGTPAWTPAGQAGYFTVTPPSGTAYLAYSPTQLAAGGITPAGFDWASFRVEL